MAVTDAIIVFLIVHVVNAAVLLYDGWLAYIVNWTTISEHCWRHWWLSIPLIAWQAIGLVALTKHLLK